MRAGVQEEVREGVLRQVQGDARRVDPRRLRPAPQEGLGERPPALPTSRVPRQSSQATVQPIISYNIISYNHIVQSYRTIIGCTVACELYCMIV